MKADGQIIFAYRARFLPFFYRFQSGDKRGETEERKVDKGDKKEGERQGDGVGRIEDKAKVKRREAVGGGDEDDITSEKKRGEEY